MDDMKPVRERAEDLAREWERPWGFALREGNPRERKLSGFAERAIELLAEATAGDVITCTGRERGWLADGLMVLMKQMESIPENDLSEMPGLQRLLNRLQGHGPDEFPYRPPRGRSQPRSEGS
jgi:hypothetical protein